MKKSILILLTIVSCFFIFNIDVLAKECNYNYYATFSKSNDVNLKISVDFSLETATANYKIIADNTILNSISSGIVINYNIQYDSVKIPFKNNQASHTMGSQYFMKDGVCPDIYVDSELTKEYYNNNIYNYTFFVSNNDKTNVGYTKISPSGNNINSNTNSSSQNNNQNNNQSNSNNQNNNQSNSNNQNNNNNSLVDELVCKYEYANKNGFYKFLVNMVYYDGTSLKVTYEPTSVLSQNVNSFSITGLAGTKFTLKPYTDYIGIENYKNGDSYSCPTIYMKESMSSGINSATKADFDLIFSLYQLSGYTALKPSYQNVNGEESTGTGEPTVGPENIKKTCKYISTENNKEVLSLSISNENKFVNKTLLGAYSGYELYLNNEDNTYSDCPLFIENVCVPSNKSCRIKNATNTPVTNQVDGDLWILKDSVEATYIAYSNSTAPRIHIVKGTGSGRYAILGDDSVNVNGLKNFDPSSKHKYIIEEENGAREFSDKSSSTAKYNYMESETLSEIVLAGTDIVEATCETIIGGNFMSFLNNNVLKIIYIGVPILLIVLTSFDFAKAVFVDDKEGIQKATKNFGKRVVVAVLIYFVPNILIFITNIIGVDEIEDCVKWAEKIAANENNS